MQTDPAASARIRRRLVAGEADTMVDALLNDGRCPTWVEVNTMIDRCVNVDLLGYATVLRNIVEFRRI